MNTNLLIIITLVIIAVILGIALVCIEFVSRSKQPEHKTESSESNAPDEHPRQ